MQAIAGLGLNLVRLGVQWADYEPKRGHYDPSYVRLVRHAVDAAARQGLRVLIYSHQVMLSAKLCGEGFPDWAVLPSVSGDNVRSMGKTFDDFLDRIDRLRSGLYNDHDGDGEDDDEVEAWDWIHGVDDQGQDHPQSDQQEDIGMELPEYCPAWLAPSYYFTPQVASAYQNFYLGQQGTMHRFGAWWADVARRFSDDPAVIGYQLLSQAFAGDYYHSPALLHPGENDARNLAAVYAFLSMQIRRVDTDHLIFFSDTYAVPLSRSMSPTSSSSLSASTPSAGAAYSSTASRDSLVTHAGVGFTRLPSATFGRGGRMQREWWAEGDGDGDCEHNDDDCDDDDGAGRKQAGKEVLAFSYECWYFDQTDPFPVPAYQETCNLFKGEDLLGYRKRDARRLGSGLFVHGLGGCGSSREERSCEYLLEEANAGSLSWSYGLDQDHDEVRRVLDAAAGGETQLRRLLSRPFARKLAGVPRSSTFDPKTRHFTLAFYPYAQERGGKKASGVTEIYLDEELHYPQGYTVSVFPLLLEHAAVPEKNILRLSLRAEFGQGRFEPGEVVVTIAPKK